MNSFKRVAVIVTVFSMISVIALSLVPALAGPPAQGDGNLPTPTPYPVENAAYELSVVGGQSETLTFPGTQGEGITIGETTAVSQYPRGMVFEVSAESANGEIDAVTLFLRFIHGSGNRVLAQYNAERKVWVAHAWQGGEGQPAWTHFNFFWSAHDTSGASLRTEPIAAVYADPTREWYRVETPHIILYWFGTQEVAPEEVAHNIAEAMAATEPRRIEGFVQPLSYKPVGVAYPSQETFSERVGSGVTSRNVAGFTSTDLGMTVQQFGMPADEWFEFLKNCIYLTPREGRTEAFRLNGLIYGTIPHEVTHLYQFENGGAVGPLWWSEGQAEYFTYAPGQYDLRLRHLATLQTLPTLNGNNIGAAALEADGCYSLAYDVGPSFINWLLSNYGGLAAHRRIVQLYWKEGYTLFPAIEAVTGVPFFELENQWRAYLGFNILTLADVDPALALEAAIDPAYQEGERVTLGMNPLQHPLYSAPGPNQSSNAACFGGTTVTILRVGSLNGVNYYEVDCAGLKGWMTVEQLQ